MLSEFFDVLPSMYKESDNALIAVDDALYVLQGLKSNSINLVFADPPNNIGTNFGNSWHKMNDADYIEWCKQWLSECMRVLHHKGSLYFMAAPQYMPYLDVFMAENYNVLSRIIWCFDSSGVQSKKGFGSLYEPILLVTKSENEYIFNANDIMVEAKTGSERKLSNVWEFPRVRYRMPEYEKHPAQKPEALLERIILCSSNKNNVVFDPFGGTFTSGAVALRHDRRIISCDMNKEYVDIGYRRLDKILKLKKEMEDQD